MSEPSELEVLLSSPTPVILDGGLASQLEAQGFTLNTKLWSAKLIVDHPEAIFHAHQHYLEAGAQIITSASYQASIPGLTEHGFTYNEATEIILDTVKIACQCRDQFTKNNPGSRPLVAASIGPYGAYLANGAEYTGDYGIGLPELINFHRPRLKLLDGTNADMLACETIPSVKEAKILSKLLYQCNKPAWVSFSCKNGAQLCDGTLITEAAKIFQNVPNVFAIGINCTAPQHIDALINSLVQSNIDKHIIVYPNSGELYNPISKIWNVDEREFDFSRSVKRWISQGVKIVGGCCRIGPADIAAIKTSSAKRTETA